MSHPVGGFRRSAASGALRGRPRAFPTPPELFGARSAAGWASGGVGGAGRWARVGGGGRGGRGERDGSQYLEAASCLLTRTSPGQITSQVTRCTQKGHGKEARSLRQNCSSAISESRAAGPFRRRDLRFSTALVRSSPSAVGEPLGVTRTTLQRAKQPICDLAARQKRRSPLAGRWPAASQRDRNRSYRILLGLDQLRVGLKGLFLDFNCS